MSEPVEIFTIAEGPTDVAVIGAVLDALGERYTLRTLQPEGDGLSGPVSSALGYGWRDGVRAFCQQEQSAIDFSRTQGVVVIHIDADVARKNKADFPRDLSRPCPQARATCDEVRSEILNWLGIATTPDGVVLCVPAQAIETWVVAALDPAFLTQLFNSRLSREQNKERDRLRALGAGALFECRDDPDESLPRVGLIKTPEAFATARERLVEGWKHARSLPEAARFEEELRAALAILALRK